MPNQNAEVYNFAKLHFARQATPPPTPDTGEIVVYADDVTGQMAAKNQTAVVANLWRTMFGRIAANGSILAGSGGYTCAKTATGTYVVTWSTAFTTVVGVTATLGDFAGTSFRDIAVRPIGGGSSALGLTNFEAILGVGGSALTDGIWNFIAMGY